MYAGAQAGPAGVQVGPPFLASSVVQTSPLQTVQTPPTDETEVTSQPLATQEACAGGATATGAAAIAAAADMAVTSHAASFFIS
jgi:hypothetical protein